MVLAEKEYDTGKNEKGISVQISWYDLYKNTIIKIGKDFRSIDFLRRNEFDINYLSYKMEKLSEVVYSHLRWLKHNKLIRNNIIKMMSKMVR